MESSAKHPWALIETIPQMRAEYESAVRKMWRMPTASEGGDVVNTINTFVAMRAMTPGPLPGALTSARKSIEAFCGPVVADMIDTGPVAATLILFHVDTYPDYLKSEYLDLLKHGQVRESFLKGAELAAEVAKLSQQAPKATSTGCMVLLFAPLAFLLMYVLKIANA